MLWYSRENRTLSLCALTVNCFCRSAKTFPSFEFSSVWQISQLKEEERMGELISNRLSSPCLFRKSFSSFASYCSNNFLPNWFFSFPLLSASCLVSLLINSPQSYQQFVLTNLIHLNFSGSLSLGASNCCCCLANCFSTLCLGPFGFEEEVAEQRPVCLFLSLFSVGFLPFWISALPTHTHTKPKP